MNKILTLGLIGGAIYLLTRNAQTKKPAAFLPDANGAAANKLLASGGGPLGGQGGGFTTNNNAPSTVILPNPGGGAIVIDDRIPAPMGYDGSGIMAGQGLDLVRNTGALGMDNGMMADIGMRPIEEQYNRPCMVDQNTCFA